MKKSVQLVLIQEASKTTAMVSIARNLIRKESKYENRIYSRGFGEIYSIV